MKKNLFRTEFSTPVLALIPAAVGINYLGQTLAQVLKLPLWLDSIGTFLAALLAGPIVGAIVGAINNILYGITQNPVMFVYALTQIGIGLAVGIMGRLGWFKSAGKSLAGGLVAGAVAVVISTPLNLIFWGGTTGNIWGDAAFAAVTKSGAPMWLASLVDEIIVDVPDKLVVALIAFAIYKGMPTLFKATYEEQEVEDF
jgi:energy-coupling factor transport system substrate-specific component